MSNAILYDDAPDAAPETVESALDPLRLMRAKHSYAMRRIPLDGPLKLLSGEVAPRSGDLVLARVQHLGQHAKIELPTGRRASLFAGDEIVVCYGERYAPDQFEAHVPDNLGPCHLVAAGGIAAVCSDKHDSVKAPTQIKPIGLVADADGRRLNLADHTLSAAVSPTQTPPVIAVAGAMMNAGKTTCAASLIRGLKRRGLLVGVAKVTGTGAGGDRWLMVDSGADAVLDFTDVGAASTAGLSPSRVEGIFNTLVDHLAAAAVDVIVVEVADGLLQRETAMLLDSPSFKARCTGVIFAAKDALGAAAGVRHMESEGHTVLAVGGVLSASPLATREARRIVAVPVVTTEHLVAGWWLPFPEPVAAGSPDERPRASRRRDRAAAGPAPTVTVERRPELARVNG